MRTMQFLALSGLLLAANVAADLDLKLESDDVPNPCWSACGEVVGISRACIGQHHRDKSAQVNCICSWDRASTLIPLCEACIDRYDDDDRDNDRDDDRDDDDDDNDATDLLRACSFTSTTWNPTVAPSILSSISTATGVTATPTTSTGGSSPATTDAAADTGAANTNSATNTDSADSAAQTTNAAPGTAVPQVASVAAVVGLMALAWM